MRTGVAFPSASLVSLVVSETMEVTEAAASVGLPAWPESAALVVSAASAELTAPDGLTEAESSSCASKIPRPAR